MMLKCAGWWAWGMSSSIGLQFGMEQGRHGVEPCPIMAGQKVQAQSDSIPLIRGKGHGGPGVQAERIHVPGRVPLISPTGGGAGVQAERQTFSDDGIPFVSAHPQGMGVMVDRQTPPDDAIGTGARLLPWFRALQQRLAKVYILNREWPIGTSDSMRMQTRTGAIPADHVALFLDPPYKDSQDQYTVHTKDVAIDVYEWAVAHPEHRIAYCCLADDFPVPDGWSVYETTLGGVKKKARRDKGAARDVIYFSPACVNPAPPPRDKQGDLFG